MRRPIVLQLVHRPKDYPVHLSNRDADEELEKGRCKSTPTLLYLGNPDSTSATDREQTALFNKEQHDNSFTRTAIEEGKRYRPTVSYRYQDPVHLIPFFPRTRVSSRICT